MPNTGAQKIDSENFEKEIKKEKTAHPNEPGILEPVANFDINKPNQVTTEGTPKSQEVKIERQPQAELNQELPERLTTVEKKEEKGFLEETIKGLTNKLRLGKKKPNQIPQVRNATTIKIEKIMEDGLSDAFRELSPVEQQQFKIKGEETAFAIQELLKATHIKVKKIFRLIFEWLKMLPGINKFFLEQEAKIKTDKLISLKHFDEK